MSFDFSNPEPLIATLAAVFRHEGTNKPENANRAAVAVLAYGRATIEEVDYDNWDGGLTYYSLYLAVPPKLFAMLGDSRENIEQAILKKLTPLLAQYRAERVSSVVIVAQLNSPQGWRERTDAWLRGEGITNQGRVRSSNVAPLEEDGLLFRSQAEINLYKALKDGGFVFAPLPVFLRGGKGYQRIEPDFVIVKDGFFMGVEASVITQMRPMVIT